MTTQPEPLNLLQRSCAEKIHAVLVEMRDDYAREFSKVFVDDWLREVEVFMMENGILVMADASALPDEVLAGYLQGDSFRALHIVECWLTAIRGVLDWPTAFAEMEKFPRKPGDVGLVIAVANAFGKAERYLNQKEAVSSNTSRAAQVERPNRIDPLREKVKVVLALKRKDGCQLLEALKDWQCDPIDGLNLTYERELNRYLVEDWDSDDSLKKTFTERQMRTCWTEA